MKNKTSGCICSFNHLCTHGDKTVKENHLKTGADRRQRKMSLPGEVGEMSRAELCVYVCVSVDCELIRCLLIPYLSHLYFLAPFNPSSWISTPRHPALKPLLSLSLSVSLHLPQYLPSSFQDPQSSISAFSIFHPALLLRLRSEREKILSFALSVCHSSLVPLSLKPFDSITISIKCISACFTHLRAHTHVNMRVY